MKIVVTGGSGFIGSHVVDHLAAAGHDVAVLDVAPPHRPDVGHLDVDILDLDGLTRAFAGVDVVFHLAAVADVNVAAADPERAVNLTVMGTTRVWEAARRAGVARTVLASTVWVYGASPDGDEVLTEDSAMRPDLVQHVYTAAKLASELVVHGYHELYGQPFTILRYGIPFGPRMRPTLVIARFVSAVRAGRAITLQGDGSQYRNYVYVGDLADAHVLALGEAAANATFNLEGTEPVSLRRIIESLPDILGLPVDVEYVPARAGDYSGRPVSADRAHEVLGWSAHTPFEEGLRAYVEWHLENVDDTPQPVAATAPVAAAAVAPAPLAAVAAPVVAAPVVATPVVATPVVATPVAAAPGAAVGASSATSASLAPPPRPPSAPPPPPPSLRGPQPPTPSLPRRGARSPVRSLAAAVVAVAVGFPIGLSETPRFSVTWLLWITGALLLAMVGWQRAARYAAGPARAAVGAGFVLVAMWLQPSWVSGLARPGLALVAGVGLGLLGEDPGMAGVAALLAGVAAGAWWSGNGVPGVLVAMALLALIALVSTAPKEPAEAHGRLVVTVAAVVCALTISWVGVDSMRAAWFAPFDTRVHGAGDEVALTFDGGPNDTSTMAIAHTLDAQHVQGTFFLLGKAALARPEVAHELAADGHLVSNNSYSDDELDWFGGGSAGLDRAQEVLALQVGACPAFFRPPHGRKTPLMSWRAHSRGMTMVLGDVTPDDESVTTTAQSLAAAVLARAHGGSIIVLHDGVAADPSADRTVVVEALPLILDGLRQRHLRPVRLDDLLAIHPNLQHCDVGRGQTLTS